MNTIKAGDTILVTLPEVGISLAKVKVKAVTQLPGKMIAVEFPEPIPNGQTCDGFCKAKQGRWVAPNEIVNARNEDEAKRMLDEAAKLAEAEKPRQMALQVVNGAYKLVEAA